MSSVVSIKIVRFAGNGAPVNPVFDAEVSFIPRSVYQLDPSSCWEYENQPQTHSHISNGEYFPDLKRISAIPSLSSSNPNLDPVKGEWLLGIKHHASSPVTQRLTIKFGGKANSQTVVVPGWADIDRNIVGTPKACVATVSILRIIQPKPASCSVLITVSMFVRNEYAFLGCFDTELHKTRFAEFAENRFVSLLNSNSANKGARAAMFDLDAPVENGKTKSQLSNVYLVVASKSGILKVAKSSRDILTGDFNITDFYSYIDVIGKQAPGALMEVGIFGHASILGPIIANTWESDNPSQINREPQDKDGRPKDWKANGVMKAYQNLSRAFAIGGIFKVWGCHWSILMQQIFREAIHWKSSTPKERSEFHTVRASAMRNPILNGREFNVKIEFAENLSLDVFRRDFCRFATSPDYRFQEYCTAAARFLNIPCWGTPLGFTTEFKAGKMYVVHSQPFWEYLKKEFQADLSACRDDGEYFDYKFLNSLTAPQVVWNSKRWKASSRAIGLDSKSIPMLRYILGLPSPKFQLVIERHQMDMNSLFSTGKPPALMPVGFISGVFHVVKDSKVSDPSIFAFTKPAMLVRLDTKAGCWVGILVSDNGGYYLYEKNGLGSWVLFSPRPVFTDDKLALR